jgi:hypothetical protein
MSSEKDIQSVLTVFDRSHPLEFSQSAGSASPYQTLSMTAGFPNPSLFFGAQKRNDDAPILSSVSSRLSHSISSSVLYVIVPCPATIPGQKSVCRA